MGLVFTHSNEICGRYFDFGSPFEFSDGRKYRPRLFTAAPHGVCIRCEAEICTESEGESYLFVVRFWNFGAPRNLMAAQHRQLAIRVRQLVYGYLLENLQPLSFTTAQEPIEFDFPALPAPVHIP